MRPLLAATALAASALGLGGCTSHCEELADRICACRPAGTTQDDCKSRVKSQLQSTLDAPGTAGDSFCQGRLASGKCPTATTDPASCDKCYDPAADSGACDRLATAEGKAACGLAY